MTNESKIKQKRIFRGAVLAAVVLMLAAFCCVGAVSADYTYSGGTGTENDPFMINTALDLYSLTQDVNRWQSTERVYFELGDDIVISDIQSITTNLEEKKSHY